MKGNESTYVCPGAEDQCAAGPIDSLLLMVANTSASSAPAEVPLKSYVNARTKLKYEGEYFPLGYPVRVLSNSPEVIAAAHQSWGMFTPIFRGQPLEILIDVKSGAGTNHAIPPAPVHMFRGPLLLHVADIDNFIIADMNKGRTLGRVTETTARSAKYLRYHFLEGAALCMISNLRAVPVHAGCVRVGDKGVLLCGDSGDGKSTLTYAGSRQGWTYITDDASYLPLDRQDRMVLGNCNQVRFRPSAAELFPELAGHAITPRAAGKPSIEVPTSEWPHLATANSACVDYIVFLSRKCADTHALIPVPALRVRAWFKQHLLATAETRPAQEATLERLLTAPIYELRYQDLGWAIDRINQLAVRGE